MKADRCPTCGRPNARTIPQNDRMWAMLRKLEPIDWHGQKLQAEEWKDVLTAGIKKQRAVPGIDGGFVILGAHTSGMSKLELSELMDLIDAFGAQQGVTFEEA